MQLKRKKDYLKIRKMISISPQEVIVDPVLSVYDNLFVYGLILGVPKNLLKQRIDYFLERVNLKEKRNRLALHLSEGEMRRLQIVRALLKEEASVFFIDEPTIRLDPIGKKITWDEFKKLKKKDKVIFLASNDMGEVEKLCDEIIFINNGKVIFQGEVEETKRLFAPDEVVEIEIEKELDSTKFDELKKTFYLIKY
ncbi:MAG: ATP-binding cassette domain-containing protein [Candidatus Hydrothermales bacterium]